jgi:hypothetical protein
MPKTQWWVWEVVERALRGGGGMTGKNGPYYFFYYFPLREVVVEVF